jgi:hypothetical protein
MDAMWKTGSPPNASFEDGRERRQSPFTPAKDCRWREWNESPK